MDPTILIVGIAGIAVAIGSIISALKEEEAPQYATPGQGIVTTQYYPQAPLPYYQTSSYATPQYYAQSSYPQYVPTHPTYVATVPQYYPTQPAQYIPTPAPQYIPTPGYVQPAYQPQPTRTVAPYHSTYPWGNSAYIATIAQTPLQTVTPSYNPNPSYAPSYTGTYSSMPTFGYNVNYNYPTNNTLNQSTCIPGQPAPPGFRFQQSPTYNIPQPSAPKYPTLFSSNATGQYADAGSGITMTTNSSMFNPDGTWNFQR